MFNWIRSTRGDHEGMKLDCEDGTEANYWLLTDSCLRNKIVLMINDHLPIVTMIEQKLWWIISIELTSANYVRINCIGLTACAFVQICRFTHGSKINTRMHARVLKERNICLQLNIQDKKKIWLTYIKLLTFGIIDSMLAQRSRLKSKHNASCGSQKEIKIEEPWLPLSIRSGNERHELWILSQNSIQI